MMNIVLCGDTDPVTYDPLKRLFHPGRDPGQEGKGGKCRILQNDGTSGNNGTTTDPGTIHNDCAHTDHTVVFYFTAMHDTAMAQGHLAADTERMPNPNVQDRKVLDVCFLTDGNGSDISSDYTVEPDGRILSD